MAECVLLEIRTNAGRLQGASITARSANIETHSGLFLFVALKRYMFFSPKASVLLVQGNCLFLSELGRFWISVQLSQRLQFRIA